MNKAWLLMVGAALLLTGCGVSREEEDSRLEKACAAGVEAVLPEDFEILRLLDTRVTNSQLGSGYREATVTALISDGWLEEERIYECTFIESFTPLKRQYTAEIYRLNADGRIIGWSGVAIEDPDGQFHLLQRAVRDSLK